MMSRERELLHREEVKQPRCHNLNCSKPRIPILASLVLLTFIRPPASVVLVVVVGLILMQIITRIRGGAGIKNPSKRVSHKKLNCNIVIVSFQLITLIRRV